MNPAIRVALGTIPKRAGVEVAVVPLLERAGAQVALGFTSADQGLATPVVPTDASMFAPRGADVAADGSLWVADTGHHRLLAWSRAPEEDNQAATLVIGQESFRHEGGRNGGARPGPATLNVPTGVAVCANGLAVADSWNHRVLIWHERPHRSHEPADIVLGQNDFEAVEGNRGGDCAAADTLFWPFGVAFDGVHLWVTDTGNRRVLMWRGLPTRHGQPADLVIGQSDFCCRDENAGGEPTAASMRWPHAVTFLDDSVCVADAGNNRVMLWDGLPLRSGQPCDVILGQSRANTVDHNQGDYWPAPTSLNMPYAVTTAGDFLVVADTANSRLLAWHSADIDNGGVPACRIAGQSDWTDKGENRWGNVTRDSLCWPYGVASTRTHAVIADAGNNRVLLWRWRDLRP